MCETKAMRNTIVATIATVFLMTGFVGCKSAPKMPWSRTAATSDVESATLAHSAPALPADIAKQAETLAATTPSIDLTAPPSSGLASSGLASSGQAAPYSAAPAYPPAAASLAATSTPTHGSGTKTTPSAYPSTGASSYATAPTSTVAATTPSVPPAYQAADKSANLGAIDMPYNPNAVPPAKNVASTTPVTPTVGAGRYGTNPVVSSVPAYGSANNSPITTAALPQNNSSGRYGRYESSQNVAAAPTATPTAPSAANMNLASTHSVTPSTTNAASVYGTNPAANVRGDRYAAIHTVTPTVKQDTAPTITTPAVSAPVVASVPGYRPGGTTSYARLAAGQPVAKIASRPNPADAPQVPNVAAPGMTPEPSQAPRYR